MACPKCEQAGKEPKIIHFERCGRWESRVYCEHTYKRAKLEDNETTPGKKPVRHVDADKIRRKPTPFAARRAYTPEQDAFILANYNPIRERGRRMNERLAKVFGEKFNVPATANALIGRYHRLMQMEEQRIQQQVRQVPSLPVLKFMQSEV